jgi:predicted dehydrogenase
MALRVGFLGTGGIARTHLNALSQLEEAEVVALCDVVEERAVTAAKQFDALAFTDHRKMLDEVKMDALFVCLPPFAHTDGEIIAAEKGIHLFVEKPVALTMDKAEEINQAISKAGVISSVGYHWRYAETTKMAMQLLEGKEIAAVHGYWLGGMPRVEWWRVKEKSGGQMVEQTTHIFDLARHFVGDAQSVYALGFKGILGKKVENHNVEDASIALIRFKNGLIGQISSTDVITQGGLTGLHIFCAGLTLQIKTSALTIQEAGKTTEISQKHNCYFAEDSTFLEAIKTKDASKILSPYSNAVKTLSLTLGANKSLETGEVVEL